MIKHQKNHIIPYIYRIGGIPSAIAPIIVPGT